MYQLSSLTKEIKDPDFLNPFARVNPRSFYRFWRHQF